MAFTKYSVVTPNLPDATCLILDFIESPFGSSLNLDGSSPPSPVLDLPPNLFIAIARVECASVEIEPKDIAPVANLFTISDAGSTSSDSDHNIAIGVNAMGGTWANAKSENNIAIGNNTMDGALNTANYNMALGHYVLTNLTEGNSNTIINDGPNKIGTT